VIARSPDSHPFLLSPNRTLVALSVPVGLSMVAEPLTGLVDTALVKSLGAVPQAALGVGTMLLSSVFWIFNFLGIGTQTEIARADGRGDRPRAARLFRLAAGLSALFGVGLLAVGLLTADPAAALLGAKAEVRDAAATYLRIRLLAAPAVLLMTAAFGALRGLQDMRTPLWIAVVVNALNIGLDWLLIFGLGPVPALGIAGAAWASSASQWLGAVWALLAVRARLGAAAPGQPGDARRLLRVGGDLFVRTGLLTLFLLLTTRAATRISADAGAAHQGVRMFWLFAALALDAFAATAQSLVGYFLGSARPAVARRVAAAACAWSLGTGCALAALMLVARDAAAVLLAPPSARAAFAPAWLAAALSQPLNALSFATDGIHWGTSDFRYLRNAMLLASGAGALGIYMVDESAPGALTWIWAVTAGWIAIRAALGVVRIWPGFGDGPLRR